MTSPIAAEPQLTLAVWPTWVGLAAHGLTGPAEPLDNPDYARGQIMYRTEHGVIVGGGRVVVPGEIEWTHIAFAYNPSDPPCGFAPLPHPLRYRHTTGVDIDPITNGDALLGGA